MCACECVCVTVRFNLMKNICTINTYVRTYILYNLTLAPDRFFPLFGRSSDTQNKISDTTYNTFYIDIQILTLRMDCTVLVLYIHTRWVCRFCWLVHINDSCNIILSLNIFIYIHFCTYVCNVYAYFPYHNHNKINNIDANTREKTTTQHGHLQKRTSDCNRWQMRWFLLYQVLELKIKLNCLS